MWDDIMVIVVAERRLCLIKAAFNSTGEMGS